MRVVDNVGFDVKKQDIPGGGSGSGSGQPLGDYVSKNGDTINGNLVLETAVGQNTSYAGLEKVNLGGTDIACQTGGIKDARGGDAKLAIAVMDAPMLCTLVDGEVTSVLLWDARTDAAYLRILNSQYKEMPFVITTKTPTQDSHAANKKYVDDTIAAHVTDKKLILSSSTAGSTKKFEITVDDSGTLTATEVTG